MRLDDLDSFLRVVERGSLTAAARELGVPKSTVSRRVGRLERDLQVELVRRGPRSLAITPQGRQLHARCAPALRELSLAEQALEAGRSELAGTLRLTAPHDLGSTCAFARLLAAYRVRVPSVHVEVVLSNRSVDLVDEGFDVALRLHTRALADSSELMMRRALTITTGLFASPEYLAEHGRPSRREDLSRHAWIAHDREATEGVALGSELRPLSPAPAVIVANDFGLMLELLLTGQGIGLVPHVLAGPYLRRGQLVAVLPRLRAPHGWLTLLWPAARNLAPRVRAFVDHVADAAAEGGALLGR